jgi:glycosyltransferase involved in cell wall biosynthesis
MSTLISPRDAMPCVPVETAARAPVRVCFLIDELAVAGTETQLLALIRHVDRRRVAPHLCLLRGDSAVSRALEPADCPVWRLGVGSLARPRSLVQMSRFVRLLRRNRIDVLQAYFPDSSYFGIPAAWLAGVPNRLRTRNNLGHWLTPLHRRLGRALNALTTGTLTNCEAARQALLAAEAPEPESVSVLENGVDLAQFLALPPPAGVLPDTPHVGAVGNLRPVKGVDVLVAAASLLTQWRSRTVFQVAGEGGQRSELESAVARHGLAGRFFLPGGAEDVPGFLAGLDVAVLPSRSEGMSNALLEYMAAGRPIVATAVGGNPELVEHGVHALLVPPDDPGSLARAVGRLLDDRPLALRLAAAARRRAREHFSREAMVRRFEDFYQRLRRIDEGVAVDDRA